ncbi:hypothetical protein RC1_2433 [Rhodospirillum centenum SW]|uniref:Uncharacterized protein n=1 Tax=Rhodospirillum centenum (strain ATCC 51521 / SW) TaxID=414684 RepID=B6IUJ2_RHOCS|nr:hypothetical protein RC1_2433 [Rhodospirillum centenum SW]
MRGEAPARRWHAGGPASPAVATTNSGFFPDAGLPSPIDFAR